MFYVYILKSSKDNSLYLGYTNDLRRRFLEHNSGLSSYTKKHIPYKLIYYEAYQKKSDAEKRESNLKLRANAMNQLKRRPGGSLKTN